MDITVPSDSMDEDETSSKLISMGIRKDILEDLCSRFLINIPEEEKNDMVRICFQIELAHWFYLDFYRQENPLLPGCGLQQFMEIILTEFPFLNKSNKSMQEIFSSWKQYKFEVPVFGAIMLDESLTKCILVRGFHKRVSWGFPKGKVNKDENSVECAVREVKEETGFDLTAFIDENEYLERNFHDHRVRLYIAPQVPLSTNFEPKTRQEIKEIKWFPIEALPSHKKDTTCRDILGLNASSFFMVQPFVKGLRKWINQRRTKLKDQLMISKYSAFTPILNETSKRKMVEKAVEDEEDLLRRKQEEQRKFQEIQLNSHPLRNVDRSENEQLLKNILGLNPHGKSRRQQKTNMDKRTENQPEAIRKLLTGTVDLSPANSPERPSQIRHTLPSGSLNHNRSGASKLEFALTAAKGKWEINAENRKIDSPRNIQSDKLIDNHMYPFGHNFTKNATGNGIISSNKALFVGMAENDNVLGELKSSRGWFNESPFGKNEVTTRIFPRSTDKVQYSGKIRQNTNSRTSPVEAFDGKAFSFAIPEFLDFKFDKKELMETLPRVKAV